MRRMRVVVACFGNELRGDDGFGLAVGRLLAATPLPTGVHLMEIGIGGLHLVQELLDPADGLVIVDTVDLGRPPGTVLVVRPDVPDVRDAGVLSRREALADMHLATPARAMALARGMDVLPVQTLLVGCQGVDAERVGVGLSSHVAAAVEVAAREVRSVVTEMGVSWR